MDPEKNKKVRDRKRKSRALLNEYRADCEAVLMDISQNTCEMKFTSENADREDDESDDFQYMEESTVAADILETQKSSTQLRDEFLIADLQGNLDPGDPAISPQATERNSEIDELRVWAIEENIKHTSLDKLLRILRKRVLCDLPKTAVTFLQTQQMYNIREMSDYSSRAEFGKFIYFGIATGLERCIVSDHEGNIELILNVDGLPVSKSGKATFWPILCRVYYNPDLYKPFEIAIYCGASKPKQIDEFFDELIEEINHLQGEGIILHGKHFNVRLKCIAADTPARSYCKNTKGHGGYGACERCTVFGKRIKIGKGARVVYPGIHHETRSDTSFREKTDLEHHTGNSPLENIQPPVDMTTIFCLDFQHLVCLGATKKLLEMLLFSSLKVRLTANQRIELSRRMLSLKSCIPVEFQRKPSPVEWIHKWKAVEFRFFLLYVGPIVLRYILSRDLYRHFLLLHSAFRILCSEELAARYNDIAKSYLEMFVQALPILYGEQALVINMHNLLHVADDVRFFNCDLNRINCFSFENHLGAIKRILRTPNKPLEQFCRRKAEKEMLSVRTVEFPKKFNIDKSFIIGGQVDVCRLTLNYSTTITTKTPNNVVLLTNGCIMQIDRIYGVDASLSSLKIAGKVWSTQISIFRYPT